MWWWQEAMAREQREVTMGFTQRRCAAVMAVALMTWAVAGVADVTTGCWVDDFDSRAMDPRWEWIREHPDTWLLSGDGQLVIAAEPGGLLYDTDNAKNLLVTKAPSTGFDMIVELRFEPTENYQFAGVIVYEDDENFMQFGRAYCDNPGECVGSGIYFDHEEGGEHLPDNRATRTDALDHEYLRLICVGSYFVAYHSADGVDWSLVGIKIAEMMEPSLVGVGAWGGSSRVDAYFGSISLNPDTAPVSGLAGSWEGEGVSYRIEELGGRLVMVDEATTETYDIAYTGTFHAIGSSPSGPVHTEAPVDVDGTGALFEIKFPGFTLDKPGSANKPQPPNIVVAAFPFQAGDAALQINNPSNCTLTLPSICSVATTLGEPALLVLNESHYSIGVAGIVRSAIEAPGYGGSVKYSFGGYFAAGHKQEYACGVYGVGAGDTGRGVWGVGNQYGGTFTGGEVGVVALAGDSHGAGENWAGTGTGANGAGIFAWGPECGGYFSGTSASIIVDGAMSIVADPANPYSDLTLAANDRVEILLNADGQGSASTFVVRKKGASTNALLVREDGIVSLHILEILGGADVAECFPIREASEGIEPGAVLVIDPTGSGQLVESSAAYDRCVAGVVSGAGTLKPGMTLEGAIAEGEGVPIALSGQVYCLVDASYGSVRPGDLLTTSDTAGHAMRVVDHPRAQGAVLGKAMTSLAEGRGLVLVLVTLQ